MKKGIAVIMIMAWCVRGALGMYDAPYWGVRAMGMGSAFSAVADDASAAAYNIAGSGEMKRGEVTAMSARIFSGLEGLDMSTGYFAGVYPMGVYGNISAGWSYFGDTGLNREDSVSVGYAREMDDLIGNEIVSLMAGVNVRYLSRNTRYKGETLTQSGAAVDIGLLARFKYGISIGYSGRYLNGPDMGYRQQDKVYKTNVIGISYYSEELAYVKIPYFTIALDYEMRKMKDTLLIGMESRVIKGRLALRCGGWAEQINFGTGYYIYFGEGEGDERGRLSIDYAFGLPLEVQDSTGSHFFGLTYRF
jgi:hypothetical protein